MVHFSKAIMIITFAEAMLQSAIIQQEEVMQLKCFFPFQRCVVVQEVYPDGLIAMDGRLQPGDQIIEINGVDMTCAPHSQVNRFCSSHTITKFKTENIMKVNVEKNEFSDLIFIVEFYLRRSLLPQIGQILFPINKAFPLGKLKNIPFFLVKEKTS